MPAIAYTTNIVPNVLRRGDKIRIKGILNENAQEFSINFVNEICKNPDFITYHFKWILDEHVIVENYKDNGSWVDHQEQDYDSLDGSVFELEFAFQDGVIDVYKIFDNKPNRITTYEPYFELSEIQAIQVWGDVKKISELTFKYA
ncbi:galactose-binding lectin l-1 [Musca vetustissima]|uniref:galactose-binding lectin l-1 n=1 Tax=Musca vetustissima TaxID=27455 RepID=UPI002AB6720B|nr:galactose-binding lectin l-1 [Musca vetustissima]